MSGASLQRAMDKKKIRTWMKKSEFFFFYKKYIILMIFFEA